MPTIATASMSTPSMTNCQCWKGSNKSILTYWILFSDGTFYFLKSKFTTSLVYRDTSWTDVFWTFFLCALPLGQRGTRKRASCSGIQIEHLLPRLSFKKVASLHFGWLPPLAKLWTLLLRQISSAFFACIWMAQASNMTWYLGRFSVCILHWSLLHDMKQESFQLHIRDRVQRTSTHFRPFLTPPCPLFIHSYPPPLKRIILLWHD